MSVDYQTLNNQLAALLADETDALANSANFVGLLYGGISEINWLGIYILRNNELVLGPFQGKPACVRISVGKGVCGAAVVEQTTQCVADVHAFPGHIACDVQSRSELVVPLLDGDRIVGVLDIDSPLTDRFSVSDVQYVESLAREFCSLQFG